MKRPILSLVLFMLLLWQALAACAQQFSVHFLPTQSLLPMASVHCLWQDREGYLWYGTEGGGLCRDNGYQVDVFRPSGNCDLQRACQVHCLTETVQGDILFGTSDGLYRVDKADYSVRPVPLDGTAKRIEALFTDREGRIWSASRGHIYLCDADGRFVRTFACRTDGKETSVASFYEDGLGALFVLQWGGGMLRMGKMEKRFQPLLWPLDHTPLQMLEDRQRHGYWVLTSGAGIQHMEVEGNACRLVAQQTTVGTHGLDHGLSLLRDSRHGLFWVTTLDNLYAYSLGAEGQLQPFALTDLLPEGNKILDQLLESRDGSIYVSGYTPHTFVVTPAQGDIQRHSVEAMRRYTGFPLLADRAVHDGGRYIWIWQGRQGLMLYDCEADQVVPSPQKVSRTLQRSSLGGVWASSGNAVFRLYQVDGHIQQEDIAEAPEGEEVQCLTETDDRHLYVATRRHLYRLSLIGRQLQKLASLPSAPLDMGVDRQGRAYLAIGSGGLFCVADSAYRVEAMTESVLSVSVVAADASVWLSTYEGNVYHYTPSDGRMQPERLLCRRDGVPVKTVRIDGLGHVWALTDQQVCEYAPQSRAFRVVRNTDPSIDVSYFYALEPIAPNCMGIDGAGALLEIQSSSELSLQAAANVHPRVSSVSIGDRTRLVGREDTELRLKASEQDIALHLTTLDHLHVGSISFAYQLEDVNRDWVYLPQGTNTIILTNLVKGSRQLRVMATDRYGCWSEPTVVLTLRRAAHWYETWWAYILYIGLALLIGYGIWRLESRISLLQRLIRRKREVRLDEIELKREDIASVKRDDELLRRAIAKVEENLSRADYNVTALSDDMCMSRITLYRRIQELTGQSPTDFIRDIRLKKAAQLLLQSPDATLSDIARKVGFATPKYFSKCFRAKFGQLPREYASNPNKE